MRIRIIISLCLILSLSLTFILFNKEIGFSKDHEDIVFTFSPKNGTTYIQKLTITREKQLGPAGTQLEESVSTTKVMMKQTDEGWDVIGEPIKAVMKRNGKIINNPIVDILSKVTVIYKLDKEGNLIDIEGLEKVIESVNVQFPPQLTKQLEPILNPEYLKQKEASEYNGRIGDYLGKTVSKGEVWEYDVPFTLPNGTNLTYRIKTHFLEMLSCDKSKCIKIEQVYASDAEGVADLASSVVKGVAESIKESSDDNDPKFNKKNASINGKVIRLIDPKTMLIYKEELERTIHMDMDLPGQGLVPIKLIEKRTYEIDYQD